MCIFSHECNISVHYEISKLMKKEYNDLVAIYFIAIVNEIKCHILFLLDVLMVMCMSENQLLSPDAIRDAASRIALCYGILMQHSFHELSQIQRISSALMLRNNRDKKACIRVLIDEIFCIKIN